jgi:regulator of protease activity HflC (stomatin/prohibitin superfamily)
VSGHKQEEAAARSPYPELWSGMVFLAGGAGLLAAALSSRGLQPALLRLCLEAGALLLTAAAAFLPAWLVVRLRRRAGTGAARPSQERSAIARSGVGRSGPHDGKPLKAAAERLSAALRRGWSALARIDWTGDGLAVAVCLLLAAAALFALHRAWPIAAPAPRPLFDELAVGLLIAAAFPQLVLERRYAGLPDSALPEAPLLERICRLPLFGFLGLALAAGLRWLDLSVFAWIEQAVVIVTALVALELALRSLARLFVPLPPPALRRSHADSILAGLIRLRPPDLAAFNASVRRQFGIDLARSWALAFIRRAMAPLLLGMAVCAWLLTGVTALGIDQRAVYEAFGAPRGVLHAGLHLHWPWPFGILRPVEYGTVREIPIAYAAAPAAAQAVPEAGGEGRAPAAADRLWDSSHAEEATYLVAALSDGRQSFEAADVDLSVVYRIGLSDRAAEDAVYRIASPAAVVRSTASQMLARYFAHSTIDQILGQNRQAFIADFRRQLQARMTALDAGLDILAIVVEGIHPPPKAAFAYQGVQAAAIESAVKVATARAEAAREMNMAGLVSNATRNDAAAAAEERVDQAHRDFTLFDGDRQAYRAGGAAFLFERRLDRLDKGLADKPLIIVDHRIPRGQGPTVNLAPPRPGADLSAPLSGGD